MTGDVLAPRGPLRGLLLAAAIASLWLAVAPATPDLAAQVYRAHLFANHGFALYDANWYGGHLLPAYSVLFPPLGALLGVRLAGASPRRRRSSSSIASPATSSAAGPGWARSGSRSVPGSTC